jgi:hypothetical protein
MADHKSILLETGEFARGRIEEMLGCKETVLLHETSIVPSDLVLAVGDDRGN